MFAKPGSRVSKVLALLVLVAGCGEDEKSVATPTPSPTPTILVGRTPFVAETPIDYEYYLIARKEGLYCVGETIADEAERIYPEARLWVPWPLQKGQGFRTFLPFEIYPRDKGFLYRVEAVDERLHTDAGNFDKVGFFSIDDAAALNYLRGTYGFQSQVGLVSRLFGGGRGNFRLSLIELEIRGGGTQFESRLALAVGNRWKFEISGSDSASGHHGGHLSEEISGRRIIRGDNAFVLTGSGVHVFTDP